MCHTNLYNSLIAGSYRQTGHSRPGQQPRGGQPSGYPPTHSQSQPQIQQRHITTSNAVAYRNPPTQPQQYHQQHPSRESTQQQLGHSQQGQHASPPHSVHQRHPHQSHPPRASNPPPASSRPGRYVVACFFLSHHFPLILPFQLLAIYNAMLLQVRTRCYRHLAANPSAIRSTFQNSILS